MRHRILVRYTLMRSMVVALRLKGEIASSSRETDEGIRTRLTDCSAAISLADHRAVPPPSV